uniref:Nucleoside phosphorylase domain-containing protein n=1 Tax=Bionectria ochroleuca TaxID=29856 RepID=A0A8H7K1P4_BIOOC
MSDVLVDESPLSPQAYTAGLITALPVEYAAVVEMLDERHQSPLIQGEVNAQYTSGRIHSHNVVIACLPAGEPGLTSATTVATEMTSHFPNIKYRLLVGIGGGIPSDIDIRLGDVVVSQPSHGHAGVVQFDLGKRLPNGRFQQTSHLNKPPRPLLHALSEVQRKHMLDEGSFMEYLSQLGERRAKFRREKAGPDCLFPPEYPHKRGNNCDRCSKKMLVEREPRSEEDLVQVHYGTIASSNSLIRDGVERDKIYEDLGGNILCFEMEAAGLMNNFPCLVIRGICDYADSHKNKRWQPFAAATAAAYAKELLQVISSKKEAESDETQAPWILPFNRNPHFTGRYKLLQRLHYCLNDPQNHPEIAIYGIGGTGKSAAAVEFAYQARKSNPILAVFWVSSFTKERFLESYREIALQVKISKTDDSDSDVLKRLRKKLSEQSMGRWLMIVDNVDDSSVLFDDNDGSGRLYDYIPHSAQGTILFTTRTRKIAIDVAPHDAWSLGEMDCCEGKQLLRRLFGHEQNLADDTLDKFLEMVISHPLAIIQAIAFIRKNDISLERYMELFEKSRSSQAELLREDFNDPNRDRESRNAVFLTWKISFMRIEEEDKVAAFYLGFLACIAPQNIPRAIFPSAQSDIIAEKALGTLKAYSFLSKRTDGDIYDVHPLIPGIVQEHLEESGGWTAITAISLLWLRCLVPEGGYEKLKEYPAFLPHGKAFADIPQLRSHPEVLLLLRSIGQCYNTLGQGAIAIQIFEDALERFKQQFGPKNLQTLHTMHLLGKAFQTHKSYKEAARTFEELLILEKEALGDEDPRTLVTRSTLASVYQFQGRWHEAKRLYLQVMESRKRVLGEDHPDVQNSEMDLALLYRDQDRWAEAETLLLRALGRTSLSPRNNFNNVIFIKSQLAFIYQCEGRWKEAEEIGSQLVTDSKQILGEDHPDTLEVLASMSGIYQGQDRWSEAEEILLRVIETRRRILGDEHPDVLAAQTNLGLVYQNQGELQKAEDLQVKLIAVMKRVFDHDELDLLVAQGNLALTYHKQEQWADAEKLLLELVKVMSQTLVTSIQKP